MTKHNKLLLRAINHPNGLSFSEFQTLMRQSSWIEDHQKGSHQIWYSPCGYRFSVKKKGKNAKGYQVKQFLQQLAQEKSYDS